MTTEYTNEDLAEAINDAAELADANLLTEAELKEGATTSTGRVARIAAQRLLALARWADSLGETATILERKLVAAEASLASREEDSRRLDWLEKTQAWVACGRCPGGVRT